MHENDSWAVVTPEELRRGRRLHPEFCGNPEQLALICRVLETSRSSDERRDVLLRWASYNTQKNDSSPEGKKIQFEQGYRGIDLRGLKLERQIVGPIDFRKTDLREASLQGSTLTRASFEEADLRGADLRNCFLLGANFSRARLEGADLSHAILGDANLGNCKADSSTLLDEADLQGANLSGARLKGTSLKGANLQLAQIIETDLRAADLSNCKVFGIAAWSPSLNAETRQKHLLVTPVPTDTFSRTRRQAVVTVSKPVDPLHTDSLEHAHLMHLMMNPDLSILLESVTNKGVLLLGRFSGKHGKVLDALRRELRKLGFLPLKFDFRKPDDRTLKETVLTLAGLCRFVIADLTEASSIPLELATIVKDYKIPVIPIQRRGHRTFSMFESIEQEFRDRVLPSLEYAGIDDLVQVLEKAIVEPALERAKELKQAKASKPNIRSTGDFL